MIDTVARDALIRLIEWSEAGSALELEVRRLRGETWLPIDTAPTDRAIWVYAPARDGLKSIVCQCVWHEDAGFCVDELRVPTHWSPT